MKSGRISGPSLKGRALRLLSQREHSRAELRRKLLPHALSESDRRFLASPAVGEPSLPDDPQAAAIVLVERVLDELQVAGWLSDARAAESLVSTKAARFGVARLRQMLSDRGVDREAASDALEQARRNELQRAAELWRRRFGEPAPDAPSRARQQRFLLSRGFAPAVVRQVTGGGHTAADDDPLAV